MKTNCSQQAQDDFKAKKFGSAEGQFKQLADKFPASGRHDEYTYLTQLSGLRNRLASSSNPVESLDDLQKFLDEHKKDEPFFKQYGRDFGEASTKVLTDLGDNPPIDETTPDTVAKARTLLAAIKEALGEKAVSPSDESKLAEAFVAILKQHADWVYRADELNDMRGTGENAQRRHDPGRETPSQKRGSTSARHQPVAGSDPVARPDAGRPPQQRSLLAAQRSAEARGRAKSRSRVSLSMPTRGRPAWGDGKVVLALVRGVLYALRHNDGKAVWAMRVGIDTNLLPVRVPAVAGSPERILVLSADTKTLTALDAEHDGQELWRYPLSEPCSGRAGRRRSGGCSCRLTMGKSTNWN